MKLKSIRISGFKSFADPVELRFHGGVTGVVGPNGCGKSNIADALRWVLGNQNPRSLRAERMEDVIFAGSTSRRPMGMAEVLITMDNSDRSIPVDFEEVSIARRLFRSGESEYLLNGSRCRLMDITDMLADCGLGSNGYWILESEMVKAILSSRTEERRFLFDEAAGITRYKVQRHRAQLKLDAASGDLERLDDIISEVRRNVELLRKQAQLLARYEKALSNLHTLESEAATRVARGIRAELEAARAGLSVLSKREEDCSAASMAASAKLALARNTLELSQSELDRRQSAVSALEKRLSESESVVLIELERAKTSRARSDEFLSRAEDLETRAAGLSERAALSSARIELLSKRLTETEALAGSTMAAAKRASELYEEAKAGRDSGRSAARLARTALEDLRKRIDSVLRERERIAQERAAMSGESGRIVVERDALGTRIAELASESLSVAGALEEAFARHSGLDSATEKATASLEECRAALAGLEERERDTGSQIGALEAEISKEASGTVASAIRMRDGYELAAGACLDAFRTARASAVPPMEGLDDGRYALDLGVCTDAPPSGTVRLSDFLVEGPMEALAVFSRVAVAPDRTTAMSLIGTGPAWTVVTPGGDLFRPEGLIRLGSGGSDRGPLERRALLKSLERRLESVRAEAGGLVSRRDSLQANRSELLEEGRRLAAEILDLQKRASSCDAESKSLLERDRGLGARLEGITRALAALTGDQTSGEPDPALELSGLEAAEKESSRLADEADTLLLERSETLTKASVERDRAAHEHDKTSIELAGLREELSRDESLSRQNAREALELRARARESSDAADVHSAASQEAAGASALLRTELDSASAARLESLSARSTAMERVAALQKEADSSRDGLETARTARVECAALTASLEERLRPLEEKAGVEDVDRTRFSGMSDEDLGREIVRISGEKEKLGPVNMLARDEFGEASKRLTFLESQKADLQEARESIALAIGEINRTAAERFDGTFEKVRSNFAMIFQKFFEGGEAQLEALPGEDPLEGGVSILARPRGKTLESISALSGGEKAMTAVALLFALYLVKPAPFCVLDELDAPLDDANVDRFIDMLDGFSKETQFIVVTHNRRTMESADRLYGVTMAGNGVSALASVSLEEAKTE